MVTCQAAPPCTNHNSYTCTCRLILFRANLFNRGPLWMWPNTCGCDRKPYFKLFVSNCWPNAHPKPSSLSNGPTQKMFAFSTKKLGFQKKFMFFKNCSGFSNFVRTFIKWSHVGKKILLYKKSPFFKELFKFLKFYS